MKKLVLCLLIFVLVIANVWVIYSYQLKPVSKNFLEKEFLVNQNETLITIAEKLKKENLIRSVFAYRVYLKLNKTKPLEKGKYLLNENMGVSDILKALSKGSNYNPDVIKITFKEGKNMRQIAKMIADNTNNNYDDVISLSQDKEYISSLINQYWFLTDDIKNDKIYYSLEGYLFPDTYEFLNKNVTIETIFKAMLDNMEKKLEPFKAEISVSDYNIHELITLASIIELEESTSSERKGVAGVFYNRLKDNWSLGSDVTTLYAEKIDDWSVALRMDQLNACNAYNTRGTCFSGLPVGPVCNPGLDSLVSVFEPENHDNYYFVADCSGKTYLTANEASHNKIINELRNTGKWCTK